MSVKAYQLVLLGIYLVAVAGLFGAAGFVLYASGYTIASAIVLVAGAVVLLTANLHVNA